MNPKDEAAERVWEVTLPKIRDKRRQREVRRTAVIVAAAACIVCGAFWISIKPSPTIPKPTVVALPTAEAVGNIAVMRMGSDGNAVLEELSKDHYGNASLSFGLTQFVFEDTSDPEGRINAEPVLFH